MSDVEKAKYLIEHNENMTIATANASGKPWVSPVGFYHDADYNLYWVSSKDARHSNNVRLRPQVAISIVGPVPPSGVLDGVYIDAEATELEVESEIEKAIAVFPTRPQESRFTTRGIEDVTGEANWRIYKAIPKEISKRGDAIHQASGQAITVRILLNF